MENVLVVGVIIPGSKRQQQLQSIEELFRLVETAGGRVAETIIQRRQKFDPAYLIGRGLLERIRETCRNKKIRTVVFDNELKPTQQRNLEEALSLKIVDRTRLILDIFAQRARTREGILQVERAQLDYFLPRLTRQGIYLDSQVGGIGTRGPGEKKLEVEQRRLRDRLAFLDRQIEIVRQQRQRIRNLRQKNELPVVAIVGYTNCGKSTLLNYLTKKNEVYADDKLFATLDPTSRRVLLPDRRYCLFVDTVGFIQRLPTQLIAAFRATLEEIKNATLLIHLVDATSPYRPQQIATVNQTLTEIGAGNIATILVYNKIDRLPSGPKKNLRKDNILTISALTGEGVDELLQEVAKQITPKFSLYKLSLDYQDIASLTKLYQMAIIKRVWYRPEKIEVVFACSPNDYQKIKGMFAR